MMLSLAQRSSSHDVWLWVSTGASHSQASPWTTPLDVRFLPVSADFIRHFPHLGRR